MTPYEIAEDSKDLYPDFRTTLVRPNVTRA
jgi:hypothetical protein